MSHALAVLVLLLSGASLGQTLVGGAGDPLGDGVGGQGLLTGGRRAEFELLVGGTGQPNFVTIANLFANNSTEFTGNWWGFDGETGAAVSGSGYAFAAQGAPFAQALATCNNGRDCASTTARRLDLDADFYQATANATAPPGDFSVCFLGSYDFKSATSSSTDLVTLWDHDTVAENSLYFVLDEGGTLYFGVWNGSSETFLTSTNPIAKRQEQFLCATYDWVASGTSVARLYVDGVLASAVKSNMVGPPKATSATPWMIGSRKDVTTRHLEGRVRLAFVTEKLLTAGTLLSMSNSLLGIGLIASTGTAFDTTTRASPVTCTNDDWLTMTTVGNDHPCVAAAALEAVPPGTNLLLWSDDLSQVATWVDVGTPSGASADIAGLYAADGSPTADMTGDNSAAAFEGESQTVATTSQTKFTWSGWLRSGTGTPIDKVTVRITGTGNAAGDTTCTFTGLTTTLTRKKCATSAAYGAGITALTVEVLAGTVVADVGTFIVWGQQLETLGARMPYIRTETVAVTRPFMWGGVMAFPPSITDTQGCARATFYAHDEQPNSAANAIVVTGNGGRFIRAYPEVPVNANTFDGTNAATSLGLTSMIGRNVDLLATWATGNLTIEEIGTTRATSGAYDGTILGGTPRLWIGRSGSSSDPSFGRISNIRIGATPESCR